jgi:uncharacterized membrane protein YkoI
MRLLFFRTRMDELPYRRPSNRKIHQSEEYMKRERVGIFVLMTSATLTFLMAGTTFALTGEKYLSQAKVTPAHARQIALKAYPGKVISEELEAESGGSGLRYSFVISNKKAKHEVGVDAKTGGLLENSVEGHNPD